MGDASSSASENRALAEEGKAEAGESKVDAGEGGEVQHEKDEEKAVGMPEDQQQGSTGEEVEEQKSGSDGAGEEEEEPGECGFCLFMKSGPCRDSFINWEQCVEQAERDKEDMLDKCHKVTFMLKECMEHNSDYYDPVLQAEKAMGEAALEEEEGEAAAVAAAAPQDGASANSPDLQVQKQSDDQPSSDAALDSPLPGHVDSVEHHVHIDEQHTDASPKEHHLHTSSKAHDRPNLDGAPPQGRPSA